MKQTWLEKYFIYTPSSTKYLIKHFAGLDWSSVDKSNLKTSTPRRLGAELLFPVLNVVKKLQTATHCC